MRTLPEGTEYEQERITATMKVMEYLKKTDRREAYLKYVHMLCSQQEASNNFTEAAITLLLHADTLRWSNDQVKSFSLFTFQLPKETEIIRKVKLFKLAISYFDKGKYWEGAIDLLKQLRQLCLEQTYDYQEYIALLEQEASFCDKIASTQRFYPEYFRVGYFGRGFPPNLQGKEFIYKGDPMEKIGDFTSKITVQFPNAELLKSTEPSPEVINGEGQCKQPSLIFIFQTS